MKVRVKIDIEKVHVDEVVEGANEEELARKFRSEVEKRAPMIIRLGLKAMSDQMLWRKVAEMYNEKYGKNEAVPTTAAEFLAMGERAGYVTRL